MSASDSESELKANTKKGGRNSSKYRDEVKPFGCENCQARYMSISALNVHIKSKHENQVYLCEQCDTNYATYQKLKQHKKSKHEMYRFICNRCPKGPGQEFTADYALKKHTQQQHKKDNLVISRNPTKRTAGLRPCDMNQVLMDYSNVLKQCRRKEKKKKVFAKYVGNGFKCTKCLKRKRKLSSLGDHVTACHKVSKEAFEKTRDSLMEEKRNWKKQFGLKKCSVKIKKLLLEVAPASAASCSSSGPTAPASPAAAVRVTQVKVTPPSESEIIVKELLHQLLGEVAVTRPSAKPTGNAFKVPLPKKASRLGSPVTTTTRKAITTSHKVPPAQRKAAGLPAGKK